MMIAWKGVGTGMGMEILVIRDNMSYEHRKWIALHSTNAE